MSKDASTQEESKLFLSARQFEDHEISKEGLEEIEATSSTEGHTVLSDFLQALNRPPLQPYEQYIKNSPPIDKVDIKKISYEHAQNAILYCLNSDGDFPDTIYEQIVESQRWLLFSSLVNALIDPSNKNTPTEIKKKFLNKISDKISTNGLNKASDGIPELYTTSMGYLLETIAEAKLGISQIETQQAQIETQQVQIKKQQVQIKKQQAQIEKQQAQIENQQVQIEKQQVQIENLLQKKGRNDPSYKQNLEEDLPGNIFNIASNSGREKFFRVKQYSQEQSDEQRNIPNKTKHGGSWRDKIKRFSVGHPPVPK